MPAPILPQHDISATGESSRQTKRLSTGAVCTTGGDVTEKDTSHSSSDRDVTVFEDSDVLAEKSGPAKVNPLSLLELTDAAEPLLEQRKITTAEERARWAELGITMPKTKLEKLQAIVCQVQANLSAADKQLHKCMSPDLWEDSGLAECERLLAGLYNRVKRQDITKPPKPEKIGPVTHIPEHAIVDVHDHVTLFTMLQSLSTLADVLESEEEQTVLYIDMEGYEFGRLDRSKLQLIQVFAEELKTVWLIHLKSVQEDENQNETPALLWGLGSLLGNNRFSKVFWDCRTDGKELFHKFAIAMHPESVVDLQLYDLATARHARERRRLRSLVFAVCHRINVPPKQLEAWEQAKNAGHPCMCDGPAWREKKEIQAEICRLETEADETEDFATRNAALAKIQVHHAVLNDGWTRQDAWDTFPLPEAMRTYAAGDVAALAALYEYFIDHPKLDSARIDAIQAETARRIAESLNAESKPVNIEAPEGWRKAEWCANEQMAENGEDAKAEAEQE